MTLLLSIFLMMPPVQAQAAEVRTEVQGIIGRMAGGSITELWVHVRQLEALGEQAVPGLLDALTSESPKVRLGAAKALLSLDEAAQAEPVLRKVADSDAGKDVRVAALILLRDSLEEGLGPVLKRIAGSDPEPLIRIEAARTLLEIEGDSTARIILERFLNSEDDHLRNQAAVALGEVGYVEGPTKRILIMLKKEPTTLGRRAALALEIEKLARTADTSDNPFNLGRENLITAKTKEIEELKKKIALMLKSSESGTVNGDPLLKWVMNCINKTYVDPERVKEEDFLVGAARGMVGVLDRFSAFMDVEHTKSFNDSIRGSYMGIGAQIAEDKASGYLNIVRPLFNGPARLAGLKSNDKIIEIGGVDIKNKQMSDIMGMLKGEKNTEVVLKISRKGWKKPRDFTIKRDEVKVPVVHARLLPGKIGYVRLDHFGSTAFEDVKKNLAELSQLGMKGIILDLRYNPGGLLQAAVDIVDLFITEDERPIVTQRGPVGEKEEISRDREPQYLTEPLVILINKASASASEIVSGALQDFDKRAILVGEKTYGKGSVQRVFPVPEDISVPSLGGRASLRLTVQYYYLPSGRCIHSRRDRDGRLIEKGGVTPDMAVDMPDYSLWERGELEKLGDLKAFKDYVEKLVSKANGAEGENPLDALFSEGDGGECCRYDGFDDFYKSIQKEIKLEKDLVRWWLRRSLRRRYENQLGRELACDFQDDPQLQQGIVQVLKRLGEDPKKIVAYRNFPAPMVPGKKPEEAVKAVPGEEAPKQERQGKGTE